MELGEAIYTRRSVRNYNDTLVPEQTIREIINAGCQAPSACNVQGWRFIVIDDSSVMHSICENGAAAFLKKTKQAVLVLYDSRSDNTEYHDYIQSAAACIENMLLMAHSLSVGTCWVNFLPSRRILRKLLSIPDYFEPIALISMGYYDQKLNERPRKYPLDELISWNSFSGQADAEQYSWIKMQIRRTARKIYLKMPPLCKKWVSGYLDKKEKKFNN